MGRVCPEMGTRASGQGYPVDPIGAHGDHGMRIELEVLDDIGRAVAMQEGGCPGIQVQSIIAADMEGCVPSITLVKDQAVVRESGLPRDLVGEVGAVAALINGI